MPRRQPSWSTKRAYEPPSEGDGARFLVERLWPRGLRKEALAARAWLKDVAPSDGLRRWFQHDPAKWREFERRYFEELDRKPEALEPLREAGRIEPVTLLYGSRDREHNAAVALREYLEAASHQQPPRRRKAPAHPPSPTR